MTISDLEGKDLVRFFCRHLVVLGGTLIDLDENGDHKGEGRFYAFTGTVLSTGDRWFVATAGHIFHDLERYVARRQIEILTMTIAVYYGPGGGKPLPVPFDFMHAPKV